ncbi:MAG: hypothetical protein KAT17_02010 [Candidatus Aminicenantes bacterium]|nr:hypothetical protein [Candidatus Aminicenantes bacterium]
MFDRVLITSGPTVEPIDPVRYISNRSSGKTGFHIANEAKKRNISEIIFITGPTCYLPSEVRCIKVETAMEMRARVFENIENVSVVIMVAAVSDYKTPTYFPHKIKKNSEKMTLELEKNPDILLEIGIKKKDNQILVGFAAETENIFENGKRKLAEKNMDLLVLNEISKSNPGFNVDTNEVYFLTPGEIKKLPRMNKSDIAVNVWDKIFDIARDKKIYERQF